MPMVSHVFSVLTTIKKDQSKLKITHLIYIDNDNTVLFFWPKKKTVLFFKAIIK